MKSGGGADGVGSGDSGANGAGFNDSGADGAGSNDSRAGRISDLSSGEISAVVAPSSIQGYMSAGGAPNKPVYMLLQN